MTGSTVISLELELVTVSRQAAKQPPDSNQQSVTHAKSLNIIFTFFKEISNAARLSDFQICRQPINENENFLNHE